MFPDVPVSSPFCRWVEELARRGVVSGCGGGTTASASATREQMAVFVLRTLDPTLDPPACTTPVFADVPASSAFCRWIEELVRRGVVTGCGGGNYCPTADVSREQMSVFLAVTFGLTLLRTVSERPRFLTFPSQGVLEVLVASSWSARSWHWPSAPSVTSRCTPRVVARSPRACVMPARTAGYCGHCAERGGVCSVMPVGMDQGGTIVRTGTATKSEP